MQGAGQKAQPPASRPPDPNGGQRRSPVMSSSPNGRDEKEAQHPKKKAKNVRENPTYEPDPMMEDSTTVQQPRETENVDGSQAVSPRSAPQSAWGAGTKKKLFSDMLTEDSWYVADSDSEDVAMALKEDDLDDEVLENDDPTCPTIPFTSMEKLRYRRKWRSALIVKQARSAQVQGLKA
ncbi:unnamed protein product [Linum tenue]|uniref:Uncharacterized protein n=1 Tax=Linum tenue TaxID=586396 RepID=A0AAV0GP47_9ROSI|nr:unnamed protein product [Linum tenue]